jgi:GTP-binding protein HflX
LKILLNQNRGSLQERCFLIGVTLPSQNRLLIEEHIKELKSLTETAGAIVIDTIIQEREQPDSAFYIGKGKAEEIAERIKIDCIDLIIFDDELKPVQVKNLEQLLNAKIIDRTGLILDIFAAHARTREAKTQVELAQLNYHLPRLTRQWSHLSRQVGGIGTKGPGETQLETDRRLIYHRIAQLKKELIKIERHSIVQRKQQKKFIRASLVGYTNAGKSTIMNALTNADIRVEDKLFATLDTTTRKLELNQCSPILVSDTVGFIRKLPHHLIASFRTTLAQTMDADILLKVIDLSDPMYEEHIKIVDQLLKELNIDYKPALLLFNKVDKIQDDGIFHQVQKNYPNALLISAKKKIRLERVKNMIYELLKDHFIDKDLSLRYDQSHIMNKISEISYILDQSFLENEIQLKIRITKENEMKLINLLN